MVCRDGRTEIDTSQQLLAGKVCEPPVSNDPFDPASCAGRSITTSEA